MLTFSIVIPIYNVAPYLRECLDSVLAQTFGDWEAICVDDGSTDGSGAILDEYAAADMRFRVVHQPNKGVCAARNVALDKARGEWIGFLDADDVWLDFLLQDMQECALSCAVDWIRMVQCACHFKTDHPPKMSMTHSISRTIHEENILALGWEAIAHNSVPFLNFYKKDCIGSTRFPLGVRFREDALFGFAMASKVTRACFTNLEGYCRRERVGSATFSPRHRDDTINLLQSYLDLWEAVRAKIPNDTSRKAIVFASTFWINKDVRQWFHLCPNRTRDDAKEVTKLVRRLWKKGAISGNLACPFKRRLRWILYLVSGAWWFLTADRNNPLGKPLPPQERKENTNG